MHRLVLMFAGLLTAGTASAQVVSSQPIEDLRENARVHIGPFYFTPTVQLKDLGIDGNVFNAPEDPKSDVMFTLSPRTELWVPIARRALFTATGAADLVWYAKYRGERSVDPQVTGRVDVYLHRVTLFAQNAYVNTRQRLNVEVDLRARHLENTTSAGANYRVSPKFSVEVAGRLEITQFDADAVFLGSSLRDTLNRTTTGVNVTARHRVTPLTTVALDLERSGDRFPYDSRRDTDTLRIVPGVELRPRALIRGSAHVGFRRFTPVDPSALSGYSGLVAESSLAYTLLGSTTVGVSYGRDVSYSFEALQPYFVSDRVGISIRRAIVGRLDVLVSADRILHTYRDLWSPSADSTSTRRESRVDTTRSYAASVGYRLGSAMRVGLGVSYWQRDSPTKTFRNYHGLRAGTTVTYGS